MKRRDPYVQDPATGESATRKFLVRFFESEGGPTENENGEWITSALTSVFTAKVVTKDPLYAASPREITKRYIGRASKCPSSESVDENLWCIIADIRKALTLLTPLQRTVLRLKHVYDNNSHVLAYTLKTTLAEVSRLEDEALETLVRYLDGEE